MAAESECAAAPRTGTEHSYAHRVELGGRGGRATRFGARRAAREVGPWTPAARRGVGQKMGERRSGDGRGGESRGWRKEEEASERQRRGGQTRAKRRGLRRQKTRASSSSSSSSERAGETKRVVCAPGEASLSRKEGSRPVTRAHRAHVEGQVGLSLPVAGEFWEWWAGLAGRARARQASWLFCLMFGPALFAFSSRPGLFGPFGPPDEPGAALGCGRGRAREGEGDEECTGQPGPCPGPCPCRPGRRCVWPPQLGSYRLAVCSPGWRLARPRLPLPERAPRRRRRRTSRPESARHVYIATQQLDPLPLGPAPHPHRTARGPSSGSLHALDCTSPCLDQGNCPRRIRRSVACLRDRRPDRPSPFSTALILIGWSQRN